MSDERRNATSASNAQADLLCPGRFLAQQGIPDEPRSADSQHGDKIHRALADSGDPAFMATLTLEQRETFDVCRDIEKKLVLQLFGATQTKVWREQRYWVKIPLVPGNMQNLLEHSGMPDVVYRAGQRALIMDYKTLAGDVPESPQNLQLRDLAVLVRGHLLCDEIAVAVIQPLVTHTPVVTYYSRDDLGRAEAEVFDRVRQSNNPQSPRIAGEVQCKFCKAKMKCGEYQRFAGAMIPKMLDILDVPVADWTPEQRTVFLDRRAVAQKWLDDVLASLEALAAKDPDAVPGWYLKEGAQRETITDAQALFDRFANVGGELKDFMPCVSVGKTKFKEVLHKVSDLKGKKLQEAMDEILKGIVEVKRNKSSLVKKDGE